jgi:hypothetical protein
LRHGNGGKQNYEHQHSPGGNESSHVVISSCSCLDVAGYYRATRAL